MVGRRHPFSTGGAAFRALLHLLLAAAALVSLGAAEVTATLNATSVPAGEGAQLVIRINNGDVTAATAPEVPDLIVQGPSQGRQINIVNGVRTSSMTLSYAVGSMAAGEYEIPPFTLTVDGVQVQTQSFKLTVTPSAAQAPAGLGSHGSQAPAGAQPPRSQGELDFGFLTVDFVSQQRRHAWVGEIAPVRIRAWLPAEARVSLNSPVQPAGSSFTLHNLSDKPHQEMAEANGKSYLTVSWFGGLSATKAGHYPPDLSMKINIRIPDTSDQSPRRRDFFGQLIQPMIQKEVELRSKTDPASWLEIRPLPEEGKPDDFGGAVGKFRFGNTRIPEQWHTGEPQQILAEIEGEGNFKLLRQPVLQSDRAWKSYGGQSSFTPLDAAAFSGKTTWKFSQVPRQAGPQQGHLAFSYFDPDTGSYQTPATPAKTLLVSGTDLPAEPEAKPESAPPAPVPTAPAFASQHLNEGFSQSLTPPAWRPAFRVSLVTLGLTAAAAFLTSWLRARRRDPARLARTAAGQALRSALQEAEARAALGDVPGFFAAARRALQAGLAPRWKCPAPAITLTDAVRHLPAGSPVIAFFEEADRQEFSRLDPVPAADLPAWRTRLEQALRSIHPA